MHIIYDMANCLEANSGPILGKHNCVVVTRVLQYTYIVNGRSRIYHVSSR